MAYFRGVKWFRTHILSRVLTAFVGAIFLNLSFILTEVNSLDLKRTNSDLYENLVRMVSGIGAEEEKDVSGESETTSEKEVKAYYPDAHELNSRYFLITIHQYQHEINLRLLPGIKEITTPPPQS